MCPWLPTTKQHNKCACSTSALFDVLLCAGDKRHEFKAVFMACLCQPTCVSCYALCTCMPIDTNPFCTNQKNNASRIHSLTLCAVILQQRWKLSTKHCKTKTVLLWVWGTCHWLSLPFKHSNQSKSAQQPASFWAVKLVVKKRQATSTLWPSGLLGLQTLPPKRNSFFYKNLAKQGGHPHIGLQLCLAHQCPLILLHRNCSSFIAWVAVDTSKVLENGALEVCALCGHPAFKGAGQLLLVATLAQLVSKHGNEITTVALQPDNNKLRNMYKKIGFAPVKKGNKKRLAMSSSTIATIATTQGAQHMLTPW